MLSELLNNYLAIENEESEAEQIITKLSSEALRASIEDENIILSSFLKEHPEYKNYLSAKAKIEKLKENKIKIWQEIKHTICQEHTEYYKNIQNSSEVLELTLAINALQYNKEIEKPVKKLYEKALKECYFEEKFWAKLPCNNEFLTNQFT